ncbi:MAG: 4Fe-4S dicluster domain-containing protein [Candidatus Brocadiia bacterium]
MSLKKIGEAALNAWVDDLVEQTRVVGPVKREDRFDFDPISGADELRLDYDVSLRPPNKVCFQPPEEVLARFEGADYESVYEEDPFVLFGVHPYDMVAINQMDEIFSMDNYDAHYMRRREAATIVAMDPQTVSGDVFAAGMGTATVEEGFDVLLTNIDGAYLVDARTEKGERLLDGLQGADEPDQADLAAREQVWEENSQALLQHELEWTPDELPELLEDSREHPVWEERAELCFYCGSCTNTCPTCYCFDVQEDVNYDLESGERVRRWDGCQLVGFARVAGDHNFREESHARYRHRYYRKGKYVPDMIGECACVGCGRCITACVANIANPPEVFNRLKEDQ